MNYIKVFTDFAASLEPLGDAERGRLFTAMLEYARTGAEPELGGNERYIWPTAKLQIDRDAQRYQRTCQANAENGAKGGRPAKTEPKGKNPVGFSETEKSQDKDKDKDEDKDEDKDKDKDEEKKIPPLSPRGDWEVDSPGLLRALRDFEAMRGKLKKPMTPRARALLLGKLRKLAADEQTQVAILERSILHSWQDVYPLKGEGSRGRGSPDPSFNLEEIQQVMEARSCGPG